MARNSYKAWVRLNFPNAHAKQWSDGWMIHDFTEDANGMPTMEVVSGINQGQPSAYAAWRHAAENMNKDIYSKERFLT
jgi:hypothetical protein